MQLQHSNTPEWCSMASPRVRMVEGCLAEGDRPECSGGGVAVAPTDSRAKRYSTYRILDVYDLCRN